MRGSGYSGSSSLVVRLTANDRTGAIDLLGEDQTRDLVGKRPRRERKLHGTSASTLRRAIPNAPPIRNARSRSCSRALLEEVCELRVSQALPTGLANNGLRARRDLAQ